MQAARQPGHRPAGKLTEEHATKLLSEALALTAARFVGGLRAIEIEKAELAGLAAEAVHGAVEDAGRLPLDGKDAARQATRIGPGLDEQFAGADFERVSTGSQRHDGLAVLEQSGAAAAFEEALNGRKLRGGLGGLDRRASVC